MKKNISIALLLSLFYLILFLPFLGHVHLFDWDEINFAEAAREMIASGDWLNVQINFEPFWEKPPLFLWLQALSMQIFGPSEFAARLPNVLIGWVTIMALYFIGLKHFSRQTGILAVLLYLGALTPHLYFRSGIIDPLFNLLIFFSIYQLIIAEKKNIHFLLSGIMLGLAVLTKGPVAILIVGLSGLVYQLVYKKNFYSLINILLLVFGLLLFPGIWFGIQWVENGSWFIKEFVVYQVELFSKPVASHGQPFYYHPLVLLFGCFPLFILALKVLFSKNAHTDDSFNRWMKVLFWVVLVLFSLVTTKIVHYSSMCYIPLAFITAEWIMRKEALHWMQKVLLLVVGCFWSVALFALAHFGNNQAFAKQVLGLIKDRFVVEQLQTMVSWSPVFYVFGLFTAVLVIYLSFSFNKLTAVSYLTFNTFLLSMLMIEVVPKVEAYTQAEWINHLSSYTGKPMIHFTQGFKSYAHLFYTKVQQSPEIDEAKKDVMAQMGIRNYYEMDQSALTKYAVNLRQHVVYETNIPFSISTKINLKEEMSLQSQYKLVFEGNGYCVWERNN